MNLKQYYDKELTALYEEAHRFSLEYPEQAASLNLEHHKATDPQVARLLEGCAFLTAKIHQRVDEESNHLPEQLIQRLWPQLAEGFPSVCMAQATLLPGLQKTVHLPAGTSLKSAPLGDENSACEFLTTYPLSIAPLTLSAVEHEHREAEILRMSFSTLLDWHSLGLDSISLYLKMPSLKAASLIPLLSSPSTVIKVFAQGERIASGKLRWSLPALRPDRCFNDQTTTGLGAAQLLFEAFAFPEKLHGVLLEGLLSLDIPENTQILMIEMTSASQERCAYGYSSDDFALFTVPCLNRFQSDCEPIALDHKHHRYLLTVDHCRPQSLQVLSVLSVTGTLSGSAHPLVYSPLHEVNSPEQDYYAIHRQSTSAGLMTTALSVSAQSLEAQTLSVKTWATNAHLPRRYLKAGGLRLAGKQHDPQFSLTNLHQPSAYLPAEISCMSHHLLQQLRVQIEKIDSADQLKRLLFLLNRGKSAAIDMKIQSILRLQTKSGSLIRQGVFHSLHSLSLEVEEQAFQSRAEAYCFGLLLHAFFQASASIASLIETRLTLTPSEEGFVWIGSYDA